MAKLLRQRTSRFQKFPTENLAVLSPFNPDIGPTRSVPPAVVTLRQTRDLDIRITRNGDNRQARI